MSAFDKIIGYESIKEELKQLCDIMHNTDIYEKLGAKKPKGLLLHGDPGVGKSLMARTFMEESGRKSYIIRRSKHDGDFINELKAIFTEAAQNAPSIILLDDMDKFVVEDKSTAEYVAVQACIDDVAFSDVYIIATTNELYQIPDSLLRAGRFDCKVHVKWPKGDDALKIIQHYIMSKSVAHDLNIDDIAKMLHGKSCAELETIINEAAIYAGFERSDKIAMEHIVRSFLRSEYGMSNSAEEIEPARLEMTAYHEAGHAVISELLRPNSIGMASIHTCANENWDGFVIRCSAWENTSNTLLMLLAGKAATELKYGTVDEGAVTDIAHATKIVRENVTKEGLCGIGALDVFKSYEEPSTLLRARQEDAIHAELERYLSQAKAILAKNIEFLDAVATALLEKKTLLHSDIKKLKEACGSNGFAEGIQCTKQSNHINIKQDKSKGKLSVLADKAQST